MNAVRPEAHLIFNEHNASGRVICELINYDSVYV